MSLSSPYILSVAHGPHFIESERNIKSDVGGNPVSHKALFCSQCWSMLVNLNIYEAFQTMWRANWRKNFYEPDLVKDKWYIDLVHNQKCVHLWDARTVFIPQVLSSGSCVEMGNHTSLWILLGLSVFFCICVIFFGLSVYSFICICLIFTSYWPVGSATEIDSNVPNLFRYLSPRPKYDTWTNKNTNTNLFWNLSSSEQTENILG